MPYIIISTQIRVESGPTLVGDEHSDQELMAFLGAVKVKSLGNTFYQYETQDCARIVLDKLESRGYIVVCMSGIGQTCVWTLRKS